MGLPEYEQLSHLVTQRSPQVSSNLNCVEEQEATGEVAELYQYFRSHFGRPDVPGIIKCFATHPPMLRHMMPMAESLIFSDGQLSRRDKAMIGAFVSEQNACTYCSDCHGFFFRAQGGSADTLKAIKRGDLQSPSFSEAERALLSFIAKVDSDSCEIDRNDIEVLCQYGWSEDQIAEAIHVAALFAAFNRIANGFGLSSQGLVELYENSDEAKLAR
jgi:uncharacterized peroxidase-related enzyme